MSSSNSVNNAAGQPSILTNMTSGIELEVIAYAPSGVNPQHHLSNALRQPVLLPCSKCSQTHLWKLPYLGLLDRNLLKFTPGMNFTVLDLIKQVGASQFTIDYYTDRLTPDWAIRRHCRLTSNIDDSDPFKAFKLAIENNRLKDAHREAVDAKISQKLEGGYYGQLPDTVFKTLPAEIQNHPDSHTLNMDACDYEKWADKAIAVAKTIDFYAPLSPSDSDSECDCKWCELERCGCKKCRKMLRRLCCDCKDHSKKSPKHSFASHLSDSSEEFPFRKTDDSRRTFATPAPPGGYPDTRPDTPATSENDVDLSYYGL
ncbi:hypothetical protein KCU77_g12910, partial [Aureobasidium melanogenum]